MSVDTRPVRSAPAEAPLVLHVFPTFGIGGAQVRFASLANRFGRTYRHAIVAMDGRTECCTLLHPSLDLTLPSLAIRKGATLSNLRAFRGVLRTLRPQVLVTSNWGSIEWAIANAWPIARHIHMEDGFGPEERATQLPRRVLARRVLLRRSTVVLPSRTLLRIATDIWRLPHERLRYIPNGIDLSRFAPGTNAATSPGTEPGVPPVEDAVPVIGAVAALRSEKNLARLLRAVRLLVEDTPARLVLVGDGPERGALETLARDLGIADRVRFAGHVAEPQRLYGQFDLFALSSDTEQMPLSVLEAMAAGLPVVATDVGDIRNMVALENERFMTPCDDAALAGSLRAMLQDAPLRRRLGAANRAKAERDYDQETMFRAYATLLAG